MNRRLGRAIGLFAISALTAAGGCAHAARDGSASASAGPSARPRPARSRVATTRPAAPAHDEWPALPVPADFDAKKAALPLAKVPGDPPAPAAAGKAASAELPRQALQHIEEARRLFAEQRYSETTQELERALRYNADSYEAHHMMAVAAMRSGDDERAQTAADKALAIKPNDLVAHYVRGRISEKAGKRDDALGEYRLALKSEPADPNNPFRLLVAFYLGDMLLEDGYYTAAIAQASAFEAGLTALGDKVADDPELAALARNHRAKFTILTARAYGLLGDYAKAAAALKLAVSQSPKDTALRSEYINMLGRAKRSDEALREAGRFVTDTDGDKAAVELLLAAGRRAGHPEQALDVIRQLAKSRPDNVDLWKLYIDALSAAKRYDDVVAALNELVSRHPEAIDSRWRLIQLTRERGDWPKWFKALTQHLQSQPQDYPRVMEEFGHLPPETATRMAAEIDQPAERRRLLPAEPTDAQAASAMDMLLARLDEQTGHAEQAQQLLARAVQRSPEFLPVVIVTAESRVEACQWQAAIDLIQKESKGLSTPSARLEYLLGRCYDGLDEIDKALEHYQQALKIEPAAVDTLLALGQLYQRGGRGKDSTTLYQKAIAAQPENMYARELLVHNLLFQSAQAGRPNSRLLAEVKDMQRLAPQDPATIRSAALVDLVTQGSEGRKAYLETLRKLAQTHPEDARTRETLIGALVDMQEYAEARDRARELVHLAPRSADAGEMVGTTELHMLDLPAAAEQLDRTLALYPNRESLLARRAQVAMVVQDYDTAIRDYQHLLQLKYAIGQQSIYRESLVDAYTEARRFDDGRKTVEAWLKEARSDTPELQLLRQNLLDLDMAAGDLDGYVTRVRGWLKTDPKDNNARKWLIGGKWGVAAPTGLIGQKRYEEAVLLSLTWLDEALQAKGGEVDDRKLRIRQTVALVVTALQGAGRDDEAVELARNQASMTADASEHFLGLDLLRVTCLRAGKIDEAIAAAQEMLGSDQRGSLIEDGLLAMLSRAGHSEEVIAQVNKQLNTLEQQRTQYEGILPQVTDARQQAQLRRALDAINERKAALLRTVSYAYQRKGQNEVAKARLREAYQLDPTDAGTNNDLGYMLADSNDDLKEGERMVRLALGQQPRQAAYQDSFGWVLYKKGDLKGAKTWLLRATSQEEGHDPVVYDHLADVEWRQGEKDAAARHWRKSLEAHEQQARLGEAEVETGIVGRVKAKMSAVESGGQPQVAPLAAESRPAEEKRTEGQRE